MDRAMGYQVTSLGICVLALLRERPMHGYEMFQTLAARHGDRILKVRPGSLYHVVYRLADEKLIRQTGTGRSGNRPERTTYEVTDAGLGALTDRVRELVAHPAGDFDKFVAALAEIHHLDAKTARDALRHRIRMLESSVDELRALARGTRQPQHRVALEYLLAITTAQVHWLRRFVETLRLRPDEVDT
ncbi:MAG: PadR family transcriptional regulator [Mycobacteriaceae bacterium]|nr:PadR family transcriptional regulator [Mycobacteriaceae bacterium]MBV9639188.1 PadR family transcriptional regulator [Mycobacteriaceae bacterium]